MTFMEDIWLGVHFYSFYRLVDILTISEIIPGGELIIYSVMSPQYSCSSTLKNSTVQYRKKTDVFHQSEKADYCTVQLIM